MRNLVLSFLFVCVAVYVGALLFERNMTEGKSEVVEPLEVEAQPPSDLMIESVDGRILEVELTARNSEAVQFIRKSDGESFVYPLEKLTEESRELVESFTLAPLDVEKELSESAAPTLDEIYIEQLEEKIAEINEELARLESEFRETPSMTSKRTIKRKAEELARERESFRKTIAERKL